MAADAAMQIGFVGYFNHAPNVDAALVGSRARFGRW